MASIDQDDFADWCLQQALLFGVNAHYVIAVGKERSSIDDGPQNGTFGPFVMPQADFDATRNDAEFGFAFASNDIRTWRVQAKVFALRAHRAFDALVALLGRNPSAVELYLAQFPATPPGPLPDALKAACVATTDSLLRAADDLLETPVPVITDPAVPTPPGPPSAPIAGFNIGAVPNGREPIAKIILDAFAAAGFGKLQQAAGLANAIAESRLNPNAISPPPEHSVGLFQLNMGAGLGMGHTEAELKDPTNNIAIIIREAKKFPAFASAGTLLDAVGVFVRRVERPADTVGEITKRLKIAQSLLA